MRKFDWQKFKWNFKDYFWWIRIYRRRLIFTLLLLEILITSSAIGFNSLVKHYNPWPFRHSQEVVDVLTDKEKNKLARCTDFVYTLMRENAQLRDRCE